MRNQTFTRLILLFAFALLFLFGRNLFTQYSAQKPNDYLKYVAKLPIDDLVRIELNQNNQSLIFTKENGVWKVGSKSADLAKINELINGLTSKQIPTVISQNPATLDQLQLASASATKVSLIAQNQSYDFSIGKQINNQTAVMIIGQNVVYGLDMMAITMDANDWYDLTVIDIDSLQIKQLDFSGADNLSLQQTAERQWDFTDSDIKVNSDGVNTFLYKFNPLKADKLASEKQKQRFDLLSSGFFITLTDKADSKTELGFKKIANEYIVKRSSDNEYFVISADNGTGFEMKKDSYITSE